MSVATNSRRNGHDTTHRGIGLDEAVCPLCEQPVGSHDRLIELQATEQERFAEIETRVRVQVTNERDAEIARIQQQGLAAVDAAQRTAAKRETVIRREAQATATAALAPKLAEAAAAKKLADQQMKELRTGFETILNQQLAAQAEALLKAANERVNAEKEKRFVDNLKHQQELEDLKRRTAKERPQELGDQGELDLFEILAAEFPQDQIARVAKGQNGPDIVQRILINGVCIGANVFEVKNHKRWQNAWIAKLRQDTIEAGASHGILVTAAFPADERELMIRGGAVVCSPPRAMVIAHILRRAVIQFHALKLSNEARDEKTAQLYDLMVSDRAADRWDRMSYATTELMDIENSDAAWQQRTRDKRLSQVRAIVAVHDEFTGDIDYIVRGEPEDLL